MARRLHSSRAYISFLRSGLAPIMMGGSWALSQPKLVQHNLRYFWVDGLFANASDAIILNYLTLYILSLGASGAQIGLMSSLASLSATILLLPGAVLVERFGQRKWVAAISGGIISRSMLLWLIFLPLFTQGQLLIYLAIGFSVTRDAFGNLALPAWVALSGDIVPVPWRGRYFASRNIVMSIAAMAANILGGQLIIYLAKPYGYQVALGFALLFGLASTYFFTQLIEPDSRNLIGEKKQFPDIKVMLKSLISNRLLLNLCLVSALWNFSLNIAGPFFSVYMANTLLLSPAVIGFMGIVSNLSGIPAQRYMGPLVDRLGSKKVQMILGFLIPLLPFAWFFVNTSWQIVAINTVGGFLWAGYSLASFNLLLELTPGDQRARASAVFQIVVSLSLAAGAAFGGMVLLKLGIKAVFLFSAFGRWIAAALFAHFIFATEYSIDRGGRNEPETR